MMTDDISIRLITYNVADEPPPDDLTHLLNLKAPALANVYAIGLQELKSTVGQLATDAINNDPWTNAITTAMVARNYIRLKTIRLMGMHLSIYVRKPDHIYVNNVETCYTRTGFGGYFGNKGAVSIRMEIFGVNICVVNCHLPAHDHNVASRLAAYDTIIESQTFKDTPTILDHDYVFWMGDLNFRLDEMSKAEVEKCLTKRDYPTLWQHDQLKKCMKEGLILVDFQEEELNFPCTFKLTKKADTYDLSKKKRKPAWTDRILWLAHKETFDDAELGVTPRLYTSVPSYCDSDHRPVLAELNFKVLRAPQLLPVMFEPLDVWVSTSPGKCSYSVSRDNYKVSAWDWIGLYKENFQHSHDYITWVYAPKKKEDLGDGTDLYDVEFEPTYLSPLAGTYYLCYYSYENDCIVGFSDVFKISLTEDSSSSDESMAIGAIGGARADDEDDEQYDEEMYVESWEVDDGGEAFSKGWEEEAGLQEFES